MSSINISCCCQKNIQYHFAPQYFVKKKDAFEIRGLDRDRSGNARTAQTRARKEQGRKGREGRKAGKEIGREGAGLRRGKKRASATGFLRCGCEATCGLLCVCQKGATFPALLLSIPRHASELFVRTPQRFGGREGRAEHGVNGMGAPSSSPKECFSRREADRQQSDCKNPQLAD